MISDMLSELRRILSGLGMLRNGTDPTTLRSPASGPSYSAQVGRARARAAFNPRYSGWVILRGSADVTKNDAGGRSWSTPDIKPLAFSSEQLYLQIMVLMVQDGKKNRTLHDTYNRLGPQRQSAISALLARENLEIQKERTVLEWKLAGIQPQMRRIGRYQTDIVSVLVILKTELKQHVLWESSEGDQVPYLRGGADHVESDSEDQRYAHRHTLGARHVHRPQRHERDHEHYREVPNEIPRIYNSYAGPSDETRQQRQTNNKPSFERLSQQQYFVDANPIFTFGSHLSGVLWSARLHARAKTHHGKGKARAHELKRNDEELIHALVEDWYEVVSVWPRSHLTVPGLTHGTSAYNTSRGHQYATTRTYSSDPFAAPTHRDTGTPIHEAHNLYTTAAQGSTAVYQTDNSTRRRQTGRGRRQGRVITLQAIINTSRQQQREVRKQR
jgi:hypothetical protein